jgi:hypothetical protein
LAMPPLMCRPRRQVAADQCVRGRSLGPETRPDELGTLLDCGLRLVAKDLQWIIVDVYRI